MEKKKLVFIAPAFPYRGGNVLYIAYVYQLLSKYFDVKIYNYRLLYPSILFPGTTQYDESGEVTMKAPSEREINSINPFNWVASAAKIIKENADLVVFDWWHPFFGFCHFGISSLIKKKYKNKILFITENYISHEGHFIDKILTRLGLANADKFLALSGIVEDELKKIAGKRKIYRNELPIYDCYKGEKPASTKAKFNYKPDDKVLLYFGYIRKYKGLDILIDAFPEILKKLPEAKLLIVGESYDNPEIYKDKIKQHGIEDKTLFVNKFVPNEDVEDYYLACDLVVLPYRSATQSGILNVAYSFYKPVVVTDVGGLSELVDNGNTGLIVEPESPKAVAEAVIKFFELRKTVDFENNIAQRITGNSFQQLPQLFEGIVKDSE